MQKRTDGWTGRRTDQNPWTSPDKRGEVSRPRSLLLGHAGGQWPAARGKSGQEALPSVQARYCSCSLLDVLLPRDTLVVPVRAPPSAHFRNREGSCRNRWVLLGGGRCSQEAAMGSLPIPEAASSQAPPPGTLLLFLPPTQSAYRCTIVPDNQDCHHSKSDEVTVLLAHSISDGPGTRYLAVYHVIKKYLGTANEAISIPISTISGQLAQGLVPFLIGWPRCQIRISRQAMGNLHLHPDLPPPERQCHCHFRNPVLHPSPQKTGVGCLGLYCLTVLRIHTIVRKQHITKERPTRRSLPLLYSAS